MGRRAFLSANEAAAHGVKLSRPHVVAAYPITPQTTLVEKLADFLANGEADFRYMMVESEHSALAAAHGASMMGARTFTATSSQGLLYMCEMLSYVSGSRHPVIMVDANRATATPWNIYGDQRDSVSMRDAGWIMIYAENAQEALDMVIQSYRIGEDPAVMLPVMLNLDGFTLTHTNELVIIPEQSEVDAFLPPYETENRLCMDSPKGLCCTVGPDYHEEVRYMQQQAYENAKGIITEIDAQFGRGFGRYYGGLVDTYMIEDADYVLIAMGSVVGTARVVVNQLREAGKKAGLIKVRSFRPFPKEQFRSLVNKFRAIGVVDRNISFGYEGALYTEIKAAMYGSNTKMMNFIAGLGGRDISKSDIHKMYRTLFDSDSDSCPQEVQFPGLRWKT